MFHSACFALLLVAFAIPAHAEVLEEVVVTGSYADGGTPGTHLRRRGDNLLLTVQVLNDSRDETQREEEIQASLRTALAAAARDAAIELSTVTAGGFVAPLTEDNAHLELSRGSRPDTSVAFFRAKAAITAADQDGQALVRRLQQFVKALEPTGRTEFIVPGDVEISIIEPDQYRHAVIGLFAQDVKRVTSALGSDYRVVVRGVDRPIQWVRAGALEVAIFLPYSYDVVPTSMSAYLVAPDY